METIEERAKEYASKCPGIQNTEWGFIAGANWMREELTRWHDPKKEQPENNVCVLIKVADKFGNSAIYLGSREGTEYLTDGGFEFEIDRNDKPSSEMKVVGWREIF